MDDWKLFMERAAERRKRLEAEEFPRPEPEARGKPILSSRSKNNFWTQILAPFKACLRCLFSKLTSKVNLFKEPNHDNNLANG